MDHFNSVGSAVFAAPNVDAATAVDGDDDGVVEVVFQDVELESELESRLKLKLELKSKKKSTRSE